MGVDRGPVVIAFPYPRNFTLAENLCWLHLIVYPLIPEIILFFFFFWVDGESVGVGW